MCNGVPYTQGLCKTAYHDLLVGGDVNEGDEAKGQDDALHYVDDLGHLHIFTAPNASIPLPPTINAAPCLLSHYQSKNINF